MKTINDIQFDYDLSNIVKLDLRHNGITSLQGVLEFSNRYPNIVEINLSHNEIEELKYNTGKNFIWLILAHNKISKTDPSFSFGGAFLDLSYNNLATLGEIRVNPIATIILCYNPITDANFTKNIKPSKYLKFIVTNTPISHIYHEERIVDISRVKKYEDGFYTIIIPKGMALFRWVSNIEDLAESYIGYPPEIPNGKTYLHPQHRVWFFPSPYLDIVDKDDEGYHIIFVVKEDMECILGLDPSDGGYTSKSWYKKIFIKPEETNIKYRYHTIKPEIQLKYPQIKGVYMAKNKNVQVANNILNNYRTLAYKFGNNYTLPELSVFSLIDPTNRLENKDTEFKVGTFTYKWLEKNEHKYNFIPLMTAKIRGKDNIEYEEMIDALLSPEGCDGYHMIKNNVDGTYFIKEFI